jgi:hypothetical protein
MKHKFLLCVENEGYEASLVIRKLYETIPDKEAERHSQVRIAKTSVRGRLSLSFQVLCTHPAFDASQRQNPGKGSLATSNPLIFSTG